MTANDIRPEWNSEWPTIEQFRWLLGGVVRIYHKRELIDVDRSREWLNLQNSRGEVREVPTDLFHRPNTCFKFWPEHASLTRLTWEGEKAEKRLQAIDAWEAANDAERKEYERLKKKFG